MENSAVIAKVRHLSGPVWVSGQLAPEDLPGLRDAGFAWLVNHRPDGEEDGQPTAAALGRAAEALGFVVFSAPVRGLPDQAAIVTTRAALAEAGAGKILMFCRSGMRSTAAWAMVQCEDGADPAGVRAAAATAGYDLSRLPL